MSDTPATVRIGHIERQLPLDEARNLFLAATIARNKKHPLAIDPHTFMVIGTETTITLEAQDAFTEEHDIAGFLEHHGRHGRIL